MTCLCLFYSLLISRMNARSTSTTSSTVAGVTGKSATFLNPLCVNTLFRISKNPLNHLTLVKVLLTLFYVFPASTTVVSGTLPVQCYAYASLTDSYRNLQNSYSCCPLPYDTASYLPGGWYRVSGSAGTQLVTSPVSTTGTCGASYPGYFNGTLPSTAGALTTGNACFYTGTPCGYSISPISVINCNGFYIYYLSPVTNSNYRYCTTP
jgi:hypothetical protein